MGVLIPHRRRDEGAAEIRGSGLRRHDANGTRDAQPVAAVGEADEQMQHDTAHGAHDPDTELEQPFAQRAHLSAATIPATGGQAQLLHQYIGGGGEEYAQLVGEQARAAGAVDFQPTMQLFDPVLHFASGEPPAVHHAQREIDDSHLHASILQVARYRQKPDGYISNTVDDGIMSLTGP